jgi:uncharacterized protein
VHDFELRDPIHGFIHKNAREKKIIDSSLFQRLRRIKQLALASLVYPGALHTRFDHSIGVMHVAGRIAQKLGLTQDERQILRFAALLHDIGHGPFSHVSEDVLQEVTGKSKLHEELGLRIISTAKDLDGPLSGDERNEVVSLLKGKGADTLMRSILSGSLDADKQDYLLRDSYFCGVKYGVYDIDRLIEVICVDDSDANDKFLATTEDGIQTLEQFVMARYHMTGQVYRHRIRLITDAMLVRGIILGRFEIPWLNELYSYNDSDEYLLQNLSWDDERLTRRVLEEEKDGYAKQIFQRLADRRLFKQVFTVDLRELEPQAKEALLEEDQVKLRRVLRAMEHEVAGLYPELEEKLIIAKLVKQKSAGETEASILVKRVDGEPREFRYMSTLFRSIDLAIQDQWLEIYAPQEWSASDKKRKRERFRRDLLPMANDLLKRQRRRSTGATTPEKEDSK